MTVFAIRAARTVAVAFLAIGALNLPHSATADTVTESQHTVVAGSADLPGHVDLDSTGNRGNKDREDVTWGH
ncbi:hypothetical protein ACWGF3_21925 [Streptomyces xanthophaeus]|uniref:Secreted protein n=1 Tax=Streptomyces xanthophaeus TaxID=67385 RepID=A0A919H1N7_9ACTN|nr:hypothetical protein [Streptomyces xanthophaeus]GHI86606.1 hypothetical protein Sxan_39700 [Streptomyces xanthophaeus]